MRKKFIVTAFTFLTAFGVGWATAPAPAECRMCNSKKCFHDSDCGRLCECMWFGGKTYKKGVCVQTGDDNESSDEDRQSEE